MPSDYELIRDEKGNIQRVELNISGYDLLDHPKLNKGCAFTREERRALHLEGKVPYHVESLEDQVKRIYAQYQEQTSDIAKNIHLNVLHDLNETVFYRLVTEHLEEMLPIIYTPTVGDAVQRFSLELRRPRGLYISYPDMDRIEEIIENRLNKDVDIIVVTDGEGVLGIGDQGIGGMNISIAKLMVYVICAGVNPHRKLPIQLDVGTNNQHLLNDPMYLGWRHERISGKEYDEFIDRFVTAVHKRFPHIFLHWEDFGRENARKNLGRYRDKMLTFNDDMQGTGAVTLAAVLSGVKAAERELKDERFVFLGAGTAGTGIADQMCDALVRSGLTREQAYERFWMVDRFGLLTDDMTDVTDFQKPYLRKSSDIANWDYDKSNHPDLLDVVKHVKPTVLIGCSTCAGAFNEDIVKAMAAHVEHPIILPLSNPTSLSEAHPANLLKWTNGKAFVATGSPYTVNYNGKTIHVAQSNNAYVFPGIGLGVIACCATRLTDNMLWAAAQALSDASPAIKDKTAPILPELNQVKDISRKVAVAVIEQAREDGVSSIDDSVDPNEAIDQVMWYPKYYPYVKK
ncbi:MAG: NAD-dependent malic enzyme [Gammaproteobacteria bacterium]